MKAIPMLCVLVIGLFLVGCTSSSITGGTTVDASKGTTTVKTTTAEGTTTVVVKSGDDSWCQTGAEWTATSVGSAAKMVIKGLVTSGKYQGLCHVEYGTSSEGNQAQMEYYFSEDGKSGYMLIEVNGQKMEQTWTG